MKLGKTALFYALLIMLLLSGCTMDLGDSLLALPALPAQYSALQLTLDGLESENGYAAASSGNYRQSVQMMDLNADGQEEAVVFLLDGDGLCVFHILVPEGDRYRVAGSFGGYSGRMYEVQYPVLSHDGRRAVAVAWGAASDAQRGVTVVELTDHNPREIYSFTCQAYMFRDTDRDGAADLWYVDRDPDQTRSMLHHFDYDLASGYDRIASLALATEASRTVGLQLGYYAGGSAAVFVDSLTDHRSDMVTDLVVELQHGLLSLSQDGSGSADGTLRRVAVCCTDIDGDGIVEVPVGVRDFPKYLPRSEQFLSWCHISNLGAVTEQQLCFYMPEDGLALEVPKGWRYGVEVACWVGADDRVTLRFYDISSLWDEEYRLRSENLLLELQIGDAYRVDEMTQSGILLIREIAVGYEIVRGAPEHLRISEEELENGLHLLQDRG